MDAQRSRRTRDQARKTWYAYYRQVRFARWFGFIELDPDGKQTVQGALPPGGPASRSPLSYSVRLPGWERSASQVTSNGPSAG